MSIRIAYPCEYKKSICMIEMHFHYVIIGLFLKRQHSVMDVEKNSAFNMLLIVKKVALLTSAIMKCEML